MIDMENPWINMGLSTQRRVVSESPHNIFWIVDSFGHYGFSIVTRGAMIKTESTLNLKGIKVYKRNPEQNSNELFMILNNNEDWHIFYTLCSDLVEVVILHNDQGKMIGAVENRLKRWQRLLKQQRSAFSLEQQMGLFAELQCLKDIVFLKNDNIKDAIVSWVGPDFDRQDFLTSWAVIEVKSHRTTKGEKVNISSEHQLKCDKDPFYLISYSLTNTDSGRSVCDISDEIRPIALSHSEELADLFEDKLIQYGYVPELIKEPLEKFVVDSVRVFQVTSGFPRILPKDLESQISSVKYTIDLSECGEFELDYNQFQKKEALL